MTDAPLMYSRPADKKYARTHLTTFQHGRCAGCFELEPWTLHVDHDHGTGLIRGMLCPSCNNSEAGGKTLHWQGYIDSTPASEMHAGLASAIPTFIARIQEVERKEAVALEQHGDGWTGRFWWLAQTKVKEMLNDGRYSDHPTVVNINQEITALHGRLEPVVRAAVAIDGAALEPFGVAKRDIEGLLFDVQSRVAAPLESGIVKRHTDALKVEMARRTPPHHYEAAPVPRDEPYRETYAREQVCAFEGCGIERNQHPTWMPPDRSRVSRATLRRQELMTILTELPEAC